MTLYSVYDKDPNPSLAPAVVPEKFSWFAAILPPVFALMHGLWLALIGWVVAIIALYFLSALIGDDAVTAIYLLFAAYFGFEAPAFRRASLRARGWTYQTDVIAGGEDLALVEYLKRPK